MGKILAKSKGRIGDQNWRPMHGDLIESAL